MFADDPVGRKVRSMVGHIGYPIYSPQPPYYFFPMANNYLRFPFPKVDTKIFQDSVKSFRILMEQGSLLLDRLGDSSFAYKMMEAAQQGKKAEVETLVKTIGLIVPVTTKYTPSGIIFTLHSLASQTHPIGCCSLTVMMKWGS